MGTYSKKDKGKDIKSDDKPIVDELRERAKEKADELRKLDDLNPLEQALEFEEVRKNPAKPGFMRVECFKAIDENGDCCILSKSNTPEGIKWIKELPFFVTDLHSAIDANIAACPANVGPMILSEGIKLAKLKKDVWKTEKRKDENMATVIMIIILVGISVGALAFGIMQFL